MLLIVTILTECSFTNSCSYYAAVKLFGRSYSGLQYDYQGLIKLYSETGKEDLVSHYSDELSAWNELRAHESDVEATADPLEFLGQELPPHEQLHNCCRATIQKHCGSLPKMVTDKDGVLSKSLLARR